jgi:hypothetical protein
MRSEVGVHTQGVREDRLAWDMVFDSGYVDSIACMKLCGFTLYLITG